MAACTFLVLLISTADLFLSIVGLIVIGLVYGIGVYTSLTIFSSTPDIIDLTIILCSIGIITSFPLFSVLFYRSNDVSSQEEFIGEENSTLIDRLAKLTKLPTSVERASIRMQQTLLGPSIMVVVMSAPLLRSDLLFIRKAGQFLIITISTALLVTILILPTAIAASLSINSRFFKLFHKFYRGNHPGFMEVSSTPPDLENHIDLEAKLASMDNMNDLPRSNSSSPLRSPGRSLRLYSYSASKGIPSVVMPTPRSPLKTARPCSDDFGVAFSQLQMTPVVRTNQDYGHTLQAEGSWLDTFRPRSLSSSAKVSKSQGRSSPWLTPINLVTTRFFGSSFRAISDKDPNEQSNSMTDDTSTQPASQSSTLSRTSALQHLEGRGSDFSLTDTISSRSSSIVGNSHPRGASTIETLQLTSPTQLVLQQQAIDRRLQAIYNRRSQSKRADQFNLRNQLP